VSDCKKSLLKDQPVILSGDNCILASCSQKDPETAMLDSNWSFDQISKVASWTTSNGKAVKRDAVKRDILFRVPLRAQIHDRSSVEIKELVLNLENLALPVGLGLEEDLNTQLSLRRSSQLFIDYWKADSTSPRPLANPPGTASTFFYVQGDQPMEWTLIPTNSQWVNTSFQN
jgi:hypothetical protein